MLQGKCVSICLRMKISTMVGDWGKQMFALLSLGRWSWKIWVVSCQWRFNTWRMEISPTEGKLKSDPWAK
jgi:hypothetical protein